MPAPSNKTGHRRPAGMVPVEMPPHQPVLIDVQKCTGCGRCIESCQVDVLVPGSDGRHLPVVLYPAECWYCGCCAMDCPAGAIRVVHPLINQVHWVEKSALAEDGGKPDHGQ
jgi:NAD-dependent dihydropyrimidine dehydrogenase PreA subunit